METRIHCSYYWWWNNRIYPVNDTHLNRNLKSEYIKEESAIILQKLTNDSHKVPAPDRNEMMRLLIDAMHVVKFDNGASFKSVWVTNAFDGSDYFVSDNIFNLVVESMRNFRAEMMKKQLP